MMTTGWVASADLVRGLRWVFCLGVLAANSCGCVRLQGEPEAAPRNNAKVKDVKSAGLVDPAPAAKKPIGGRVALDWQQVMLETLAKDPAGYREAWALFSEGGWANAGQVMVYSTDSQAKQRLVVVEPGEDRIKVDRALSAEAFAAVAKGAKAAESLSDLDMVAFDALTFEYVHAVKDAAGKVAVSKRVFIRNGGKKDSKDYDALIAVFQQLRPAQH